jgi:hypothetical protein
MLVNQFIEFVCLSWYWMKNERNSRFLSKTMKEKLITRKWYVENVNQWSWKKWKNSLHVKIWTSNFEHKITFFRRSFFYHSIILSFIFYLNINYLSWTSKTLINFIIITSLSNKFEEQEDLRQHFVNYVWKRTNDVKWKLVLANAQNAQKWKKRLMNVTWMRRYLLNKQRVLRSFISIKFAIDEIN